MRFESLMASIALAAALAGCQAQGLVGVGAGGATNPGGQPAVQPGAGAAVATKLGAYEFKPLSADAAAQLAGRASTATAGGERATAAPMAADAKMARPAIAGMSILPGSPYAHGTYFSGPYGPMKLESATEAKGAGSTGGWAEIKAQVVAPVLADWTTDARLIASHGMLDADGNTATGDERWPGELGWRATYAAPARNEVLEFHVTAAGTTITRLKWTPIDLNLDATSVDARAALATIAAAVKDRAAKSEEDKLGYDYFFGKDAGGGMVGIMNKTAVAAAGPAVAPAVDVAEPIEPGPASDPGPIDAPPPDAKPVPAPVPVVLPAPKTLYTLAPGGRWNASLNAIGDKVVWELSYDPGEKAWQPPQDGWAKDPSAYGMVDAATGQLIRLRRPSEFYVGLPTEAPGSEPMPRPMI